MLERSHGLSRKLNALFAGDTGVVAFDDELLSSVVVLPNAVERPVSWTRVASATLLASW